MFSVVSHLIRPILHELFSVQRVSGGNLRALLSKVNETLHCLKFPTIALKLLQPYLLNNESRVHANFDCINECPIQDQT